MRRAQEPSERGFTGHDRQRLRRKLKQAADARTFRRIQAVLLTAEGMPVADVARITASSQSAVYQWVAWYLREHKVEVLTDLPRSGRPPAAERITDARIKRELNRDPLRLGYNALDWTAPLLATHLSTRYDTAISTHTLRRRMRRMGLRWKRPRHAFTGKDPNRAQKKAHLFGH
jgi:transposase